jgi:hypothetical protein
MIQSKRMSNVCLFRAVHPAEPTGSGTLLSFKAIWLFYIGETQSPERRLLLGRAPEPERSVTF